jgi:hypothetical protein
MTARARGAPLLWLKAVRYQLFAGFLIVACADGGFIHRGCPRWKIAVSSVIWPGDM